KTDRLPLLNATTKKKQSQPLYFTPDSILCLRRKRSSKFRRSSQFLFTCIGCLSRRLYLHRSATPFGLEFRPASAQTCSKRWCRSAFTTTLITNTHHQGKSKETSKPKATYGFF